MNIGEKQGEVFIVEPLQEPVPIEIPVETPQFVEEPELVPVKKGE